MEHRTAASRPDSWLAGRLDLEAKWVLAAHFSTAREWRRRITLWPVAGIVNVLRWLLVAAVWLLLSLRLALVLALRRTGRLRWHLIRCWLLRRRRWALLLVRRRRTDRSLLRRGRLLLLR